MRGSRSEARQMVHPASYRNQKHRSALLIAVAKCDLRVETSRTRLQYITIQSIVLCYIIFRFENVLQRETTFFGRFCPPDVLPLYRRGLAKKEKIKVFIRDS